MAMRTLREYVPRMPTTIKTPTRNRLTQTISVTYGVGGEGEREPTFRLFSRGKVSLARCNRSAHKLAWSKIAGPATARP
jgi:hypothetical protein